MKKKLFGLLLVTASLVGCGTNVNENSVSQNEQVVANDAGLVESVGDSNILTPKVEIKKSKTYIGENETITMSPVYIQLVEKESEQYLRYAVAIKGDFENIYWTRKIEGKEDSDFEVKQAYKGLTSGNDIVYYTGNGISTDSSYENKYYWVIYIAKFSNDAYKNKDLTLNLNIVDRSGNINSTEERSTSLNYEINYSSLETSVMSQWSSKVTTRENGFNDRGIQNNGTLFIGDSFFDTDEFWTDFYTKYYGSKNVYSANISATTITDWQVFANRLIYPFAPKNIVIHCGTNDLYDDKHSADVVSNDTKHLIESIHANLPSTKIYYFGIEPRTNGINNEDVSKTIVTLNSVNNTMKSYCDSKNYLTYLNSPSFCYNQDGSVKSDFFRDGVHPKLENYQQYVTMLTNAGLSLDNNANKVNNFVTDVNKGVSETNRLFYCNGVAVTKNFVLSGSLKIDSTSNNAHIQFSFETNPLNRFLLWDSDNDGNFALGWACEGEHISVAPSRSNFSKNNVINWKIIVTEKNGYIYINDSLEAVMLNAPIGNAFKIGTENCSVSFTNMSILTKESNTNEFNNIVNGNRIQQYEQLASVDTSRRIIRDYQYYTDKVQFNYPSNTNWKERNYILGVMNGAFDWSIETDIDMVRTNGENDAARGWAGQIQVENSNGVFDNEDANKWCWRQDWYGWGHYNPANGSGLGDDVVNREGNCGGFEGFTFENYKNVILNNCNLKQTISYSASNGICTVKTYITSTSGSGTTSYQSLAFPTGKKMEVAFGMLWNMEGTHTINSIILNGIALEGPHSHSGTVGLVG